MSDSAAKTPLIMVVEDEQDIASAIDARLVSEGFTTHIVHDGLQAVADAERINPDVMILDVMLPGLDGIEVCRRVQQHRPVPVIMVTARDEETDKIIGLGVGADDYLTKPFSPRELVARVRALLRRVDRAAQLATGHKSAAVVWGPVVVDPRQRRVTVDGDEVQLTPTEYDLLSCLLSDAEAVWPREKLLAEVWDWHDAAGTRTVDSHVKGLRRKIGSSLIRTVHGVGYALVADSPDADEPHQQTTSAHNSLNNDAGPTYENNPNNTASDIHDITR